MPTVYSPNYTTSYETLAYGPAGERALKRLVTTQYSPVYTATVVQTKYLHGSNDWPLVEYEETTVNSGPQPTKVTRYIYGPGGILAIHKDSTMTLPLTDHIGSTRVVLSVKVRGLGADATTQLTGATIAEKYRYFPFGAIAARSGSLSEYVFTGQEYDSETGLHNYRARMMSGTDELGRFFAMDPQAQFHSPYVYAANNPVSLTDPDGEFVWLVPVAIGVAVGGYQGYQMGRKHGATGWELAAWTTGGAVIGGAAGYAGWAAGAQVTAGWTGVKAGFWYGAATGGAGGAAGGFVNGFGMTMLGGGNLGDAYISGFKQGAIGGASGGIIGGVFAGVSALNQDRNFWSGAVNGGEPVFSNGSSTVAQWKRAGIQISEPKGATFNAIDMPAYRDPLEGYSWFFEQTEEVVVTAQRMVSAAEVVTAINPIVRELYVDVFKKMVFDKNYDFKSKRIRNKKGGNNAKGLDCSGLVDCSQFGWDANEYRTETFSDNKNFTLIGRYGSKGVTPQYGDVLLFDATASKHMGYFRITHNYWGAPYLSEEFFKPEQEEFGVFDPTQICP
jgi:RHS repeat-associated protein